MSFSGNQSCILGGSSRSVFTTDSLLPKSHGAFTVLFHEFFEKCFLVRQTLSSAVPMDVILINGLGDCAGSKNGRLRRRRENRECRCHRNPRRWD